MSNIDDKIAAIMNDIPKFRAECDAAARAQLAEITQEALDASWAQMSQQFGLVDDGASAPIEPAPASAVSLRR